MIACLAIHGRRVRWAASDLAIGFAADAPVRQLPTIGAFLLLATSVVNMLLFYTSVVVLPPLRTPVGFLL